MPTAPLTYLHPLNPKGGMEPRTQWARVSFLRREAPRAEYGPTGGEGGSPPGAPHRPHLSEAARLPSSKSSPPADSAENCVKLPEARPRLPVPSPPPPLPHSPAEARPGSGDTLRPPHTHTPRIKWGRAGPARCHGDSPAARLPSAPPWPRRAGPGRFPPSEPLRSLGDPPARS